MRTIGVYVATALSSTAACVRKRGTSPTVKIAKTLNSSSVSSKLAQIGPKPSLGATIAPCGYNHALWGETMSTGYEEAKEYARRLELAELEDQAAEALLLGVMIPIQFSDELDQLDRQLKAQKRRAWSFYEAHDLSLVCLVKWTGGGKIDSNSDSILNPDSICNLNSKLNEAILW